MNELMQSSAFLGVLVTLGAYQLGEAIRRRTGFSLANPLLIAILLVMALLSLLNIDYAVYSQSARLISVLLTPSTVCLAVPLYEQFSLLRRHARAVLAGIAAGVATSLLCVFALSLLFGLDHAAYATLLPKSITTAIGMEVSARLGGHVSITVAIILVTGILGNVFAKSLLRLLRITEPIAAGVAIGTASHAIGTARAMELGDVEGAMSSLSIVVSGLLTVAGASLMGGLI